MIYLSVSGRLGNQMFQYAFARKLHIMRGCSDRLCFSFVNVLSRKNEGVGFEDALRYFNVMSYQTRNTNLLIRYGKIQQVLLYVLNKFTKDIVDVSKFENNGILFSHQINDRVYSLKNIFLLGKFEYPLFFSDISDLLKNEFTPIEPPLESNRELYGIINNTNSICVSIRRGDYLSTNNIDNFYLCNEVYFNKAIECLKKRVKAPVFVFFSDDIEWVKNNIHIYGAEVCYESGNDPIWEKLRLMYSCKHFIISNSTFSWWAQYLSRNKEKIVVSPSRWFVNESWESYLLDESFVKIDV